ncbi:MAG: hypothetical protein QM724_06915 [Flavobacteriales bacterium]
MTDRIRTCLVFAIILFLCSWHLDTGPNDNTMSRAAAVASLVDRGTLEITPVHEVTNDKAIVDGRYYSDKAPLPVLLVWPFHMMMDAMGLAGHTDQGSLGPALLRLGGFLCGSLALALIIVLMYRDLRARTSSIGLPTGWAALLPFAGSFLFVYSGSFNAHLLGALFVLAAWLAFERKQWWLCGLWSGAAVLCEYPLAVFPIWWALEIGWLVVQKKVDRKAIAWFVAGGGPAVLVLMTMNKVITGNPFTMAYTHEAHYTFMARGYGMGLPSWDAFVGLTISDYRGLLFFMPALLVALPALARAGSNGRTAMPRAALVPVLLCFLVISGYGMWWGGWAYGPRHLTAVATLLMLFGLRAVLDRRSYRWPLLVVSVVGLAMAFAAKDTVWYSLPTEAHHPLIEVIWPALRNGSWTTDQWPVMLGLSPAMAALLYLPTFALGLYLLARLDRKPTDHAPLPHP